MTYHIQIDEDQRQAIQDGLEALDEMEKPLPEFLLSMIQELPKNERDNPGILHGLTL